MKLAIILLSALLAACGKGGGGLGAGAESNAQATMDQSRKIDRSREVSAGTSVSSSVSMPAAALIVPAARSLSEPVEPLRAQLAKSARAEGFALLAGDELAARIRAATILAAVHAPRVGWEIEPEDRSKQARAWFLAAAAAAEFADRIETAIPQRIGTSRMRDPDDATETIKAILLLDLPIEQIRTAAQEAVAVARANLAGGIVPDLASGQGIAFTAGGVRYSADASGWAITRDGVDWFGKGLAGGKKYEIALDSSLSTQLSRKKVIDQGDAVNSSNSQKASAEVR